MKDKRRTLAHAATEEDPEGVKYRVGPSVGEMNTDMFRLMKVLEDSLLDGYSRVIVNCKYHRASSRPYEYHW